MIARPINRPQPIPFADTPASGAHGTRPVSWAASLGPTHLGAVALASPVRRSPVLAEPSAPPCAHTSRLGAHPPASGSHRPGPTTADKAAGNTELYARFTGQGSLSVRSSVTGRHYRFQGHGDSQKIDKLDTMLLRRINDLIVG